MNKTILIDDNAVMSKPQTEFYQSLLKDLNEHNKEFPKPEELFVTMLRNSTVGKFNTEAKILNKKTNTTRTVKYDRLELSHQVHKHTLPDNDPTGKPIRVGINTITKQLDINWLKGLGFPYATENDFNLISVDRNPNTRLKQAKLYNCSYKDGILQYIGNPKYESGINGMLIEVNLVPDKIVTLELPSKDKCLVTVTTPQLIDGKYLLSHLVKGETTSTTQFDTIRIQCLPENKLSIETKMPDGTTVSKDKITPPSNPILLKIKIIYPNANRLDDKWVKFHEDDTTDTGIITSNLKPVKIPPQIAEILTQDEVKSKISHDFFVVEAKADKTINLMLEDRTDFKGEKFSRSFYIGDESSFNRDFYNLIQGVESDNKSFKVFTREDRLKVIHNGKMHLLKIDPDKGYGFNVDIENEIVIFNTDIHFNSLEEMYEDLTVPISHIKVFHVPGISTLKEPLVLLMEAEETSRDNPAISMMYKVEEVPFNLNTDWEADKFLVNKISVTDAANMFVRDSFITKDDVVVKPALTTNMEMDDSLAFLIPEEYHRENTFAYQISLPGDTTLKLKNVLNIPYGLNYFSIHDTVEDMKDLGRLKLINTVTLKDETKLEVEYPLFSHEKKEDTTTSDIRIERKGNTLNIHTPMNGTYTYHVTTNETIYLSQLVVLDKGYNDNLFKSSGVVFE